MKKKILIINNSSHISGAEISLLTLLDSLKDQYDFTLIIPGKGNLYSELIKLEIDTKLVDMKRLSRTSGVWNQLKWVSQVFSTAVKISRYVRKEKFDTIYANSNQAIPYAISIKIFTGKKLIWHVRDNLKSRSVSKILAFFSNKIICISKFIYEQVPARQNKKHLVYNGINCDLWTPRNKDDAIFNELNLPDNVLLVGNVGQLIPWKNHLDFIEIMEMVLKEFRSVHFLIIGDNFFEQTSNYVTMLKKTVEQRNLQKHVTFLGYRKDSMRYMNRLDILAHCATTEPLGRVVMEASALEKPIVAYNSGGVREIVSPNETGFLSPKDNHQQFAENLIILLKDARLRARFGTAGRTKVCEKFSHETMANEIQKIIEL